MATTKPLPCPECGREPRVYDEFYGVTAYCPNCYDGAPDAGEQIIGQGLHKADAVEAWNERVDDYKESNP